MLHEHEKALLDLKKALHGETCLLHRTDKSARPGASENILLSSRHCAFL